MRSKSQLKETLSLRPLSTPMTGMFAVIGVKSFRGSLYESPFSKRISPVRTVSASDGESIPRDPRTRR